MRLRKDTRRGFAFYHPGGVNGIFANYAAFWRLRQRNGYATSVEHLYQAAKFSNRRVLARKILRARTPEYAKELARRYRGRRDPAFDAVKADIMALIIAVRGALDPPFADALFRTGRHPIVEWTDQDPYWGRGPGGGSNHAGEILVRLRDSLRNGGVARTRVVAPPSLAQRRFLERTVRWLKSISAMPRSATSRPRSSRLRSRASAR